MDAEGYSSLAHTVENACAEIRNTTRTLRNFSNPTVGIILGTGMGSFAHEFEDGLEIPYEALSGFQTSTVSSHSGKLLFGRIGNASVVAMNGRSHYYEGFTTAEICLPVLVLHALGIQTLIIGNASGGVNPKFKSGEVMIIQDHLDLMFMGNNTVYRHPDEQGANSIARPDERVEYSSALIQQAHSIARQNNIVLHQGVYAALSGPTYETRGEYRMIRKFGADVVGMSTIPEANVASGLGINVCGLSTITNVANPDLRLQTTHQEVIAAVESAEKSLRMLLRELIAAN